MRGREPLEERARIRADIVRLHERFPSLRQLTPPVRELFIKGEADLLWKNELFVAIIGTRKATTYGVKTADMFAGHLSRNGCCVVSGLAMGIDAAAHRGALARGGNTIGVSATGIDSVYPLTNRKLFEQMYRRACIVSEHDGAVDAAKYRFPLRNRIVAALSDLIIVIEAPEKSGALLTVDYALELGKPIMSVPGSIFSVHSIGSNRLIDQGATPLCSTRQLDEYLEIHRSRLHRVRAVAKGGSVYRGKNGSEREDYEIEDPKIEDSERGDSERGDFERGDFERGDPDSCRGERRFRCLSPQSSEILHYIRTKKCADVYEMALSADVSITDALDILSELAQEGIVKQVAVDQYIYLL